MMVFTSLLVVMGPRGGSDPGRISLADICWEKYIKGKYINGLPMHADRAHYGVCRKKCFI